MGKLIETTCNLIDKQLMEMEVKQEGTPVRISFDSDTVESFRECIGDDEEPRSNEVLVCFKSGNDIILNMSYDALNQKLKYE